MNRYCVTFGLSHRRITHGAIELSPEGWIEVLAPDSDEARALVDAELGERWAFIYDAKTFERDRRFYALGCLAVLTKDGFEGLTSGLRTSQAT